MDRKEDLWRECCDCWNFLEKCWDRRLLKSLVARVDSEDTADARCRCLIKEATTRKVSKQTALGVSKYKSAAV